MENQASKPAMIIGITGGIASGKSTLCKYLNEKFGVIHFDADKEIHALYEPGTEGYKEVVKSFGSEILNDDKSINRKILGEKVFGKPERMEALRTAIGDIPTHFKNLLVNKYRKYPEGKVVIFEAVNLFESSTACIQSDSNRAGNTTAAAATGPAIEPRPTSSVPAIKGYCPSCCN